MMLDIEPSDYDFAVFMCLENLHVVCLLNREINLQRHLRALQAEGFPDLFFMA